MRQEIDRRYNLLNNDIDLAIKEGREDDYVKEMIKNLHRWRCRNDLFHLCKVTGHDKIVDSKYGNYYRDFCDEVSTICWQVAKLGIHPINDDMIPLDDLGLMQRLYLCFRTFWKTSIISKVNTLQLLLNFPNIHIVLCHNKQDNASDNLVAIKNMFLTTDLKNYFPEYIPKGKDWGNMTGFSVACRTDWSRTEDNVEAVGVGTEITGRHWQIAKKNDLVTEDSVYTKEQIEKTVKWDERFNIGHFDDPQRPLQDYEGTRYNFSDLYSKLKDDPRIKFIKIPILSNFEDNTTCPLPQRFSPKEIEDLKKDPWTFWCQMMLEPKDPAKMRFNDETIKYYPEIPIGLNYYLLVDPASRRKKRSDYTVMLVVGVNHEKKRYIVDGLRDKLDPKQRIDEAIRLAKRWDIKSCAWEAIGFQDTDRYYFEERRRIEDVSFILESIKAHSRAKEDRIRSLIPEYTDGKWLWPPKGAIERVSKFDGMKYDLTEEMELEALHFPLGEHDDLLDAMGFLHLITTLVFPQPIKEQNKPQEMTFGDYKNQMNDKREALKRNPWLKFEHISRT